MMDDTKKPHEALEGLELTGGWIVDRRLQKSRGSTGGHFSCGYLVSHPDGRRGYLKALDFFSRLPTSPDPARDLEPLIKAYNFERDLLARCRSRRLSRVVTALDDGAITVPGFPPPSTVQYIIFELAQADFRAVMGTSDAFDICLALRALHHVAVGLEQLHRIGIAHQDLKPSNILVFEDRRSSKLADLGRAAAKGSDTPHYGYSPAGDVGYAPPESLYSAPVGSWEVRRTGCDIYHLGSMICSVFTGLGMTPLLLQTLDPALHWRIWRGPYDEALVFLRPAFADAVEYVSAEIPAEIRAALVGTLKELCDPDPARRGHPKDIGGGAPGLERYVTRFNYLAVKAEVLLRRVS